MKTLYMAAAALGIVAVTTAAQADIVCTQHRGCYETGGPVYTVHSERQSTDSVRSGKKQRIRLREVIQGD